MASVAALSTSRSRAPFYALDGIPSGTPSLTAARVRDASRVWLTPDGVVLAVGATIAGPHWAVRGVRSATVAEGRLVYVKGNALYVRRISDGEDRLLLPLPHSVAGPIVSFSVAAGSFGIALVEAVDDGKIARAPHAPTAFSAHQRVIWDPPTIASSPLAKRTSALCPPS